MSHTNNKAGKDASIAGTGTQTLGKLPAAIDDLIEHWSHQSLPPVDQWHPSAAGVIDIRILKSGEWLYQGTPILRPRLVQLFASVLRVEEDGSTWLVTPVEKLRITVDDAHFQAVLMDVEEHHQQAALVFTTNIGERVTANAEHLIDVQYPHKDGSPEPFLHVRQGLTARITRAVFIQLAQRAEVRGDVAGVTSCGVFMALGPAE